MSNSDSFIDEVTEEVRRDRLFALMRRYGWIVILAVVLLVAGAAWNEYRKAQARAAAEALGDSLLSAFRQTDPAARARALAEIGAEGDARAVVAMLRADAEAAAGNREGAAQMLLAIAGDERIAPLYRDMARLKRVILLGPGMDRDERIAALRALARPGAPYRLLAEEQLAVIDMENGDTEAAIARLKDIEADSETPTGMRQRARQTIIVLGGEPEEPEDR